MQSALEPLGSGQKKATGCYCPTWYIRRTDDEIQGLLLEEAVVTSGLEPMQENVPPRVIWAT